MISTSNSNKGVSVVLGYVMILAISVVLMALLVGAFGSNLDNQEKNAIESEMEIAAVQIATNIEKVDSTVQRSGSITNLTATPEFTDRAGSPGYQVYIDSHPDTNIYVLRIETQDQTITKKFISQTDVDTNARADSTSLQITYENATDSITLKNRDGPGLITAKQSRTISGDYTIPAGAEEVGLDVEGNITGGDSATISGPLNAGGDIQTDPALQVYDDVSGQNVSLDDNSTVSGNINATNAVTLGTDVKLEQAIDASTLTTGKQANIGDNLLSDATTIETTGNITIEASSYVNGTIESDGVVTIHEFTDVTSHVNVNNGTDLVCDGSNITINGKDCSTYKADNY